MIIDHWKDVEDVKIEKFPFKGVLHDVIGTSVLAVLTVLRKLELSLIRSQNPITAADGE